MNTQQILNVLQGSRFGMSAKEVAKATGQPAADVGAALFQMEIAGQVGKRMVGRDSVWIVKVQTKPAQKKRAAPVEKAPPKPLPLPMTRIPIAGHVQLDVTGGPIRLGFSNLNDLQGFINKLNEGQ
ncbi:hypothetical protein [Aquitalea magnusonii]|uniref:hypothetical protein n=1 Tax=Aquitalea magnusonii TaxID=332411 RepID=UPI000E651780|nr:hypothetical protein [Aquitalea magnusonii]